MPDVNVGLLSAPQSARGGLMKRWIALSAVCVLAIAMPASAATDSSKYRERLAGSR
jgi:hypothetical protein